MPAAMRSPAHPDGLFGQLTGWRNEQAWIAHIPVSVARPAVAQARLALKAHEAAVQARSARLNEESAVWARWMSEEPAWDPGVWDALDAEEKRLRAKAGLAPPRSVSTWRDERASDGSRRARFRKRKRSARRAVTWNTGPLRVDAVTIRLPGLGDVRHQPGLRNLSKTSIQPTSFARPRLFVTDPKTIVPRHATPAVTAPLSGACSTPSAAGRQRRESSRHSDREPRNAPGHVLRGCAR